MSTISTTGTFFNRMLEAVGMSEKNRKMVGIRRSYLRGRALATVQRARRYAQMDTKQIQREVDIATSVEESKDDVIKNLIADENWGYRLTTMYGLATLAEGEQKSREQRAEIIALLRQNNQLLRELVESFDYEPVPEIPQIPAQRTQNSH